jgi:hypothetical protein
MAIPSFAFEDGEAQLAIHFVDGQARFHVGEVVPIELEFSASLPGGYEIDMAGYDRSGRLGMEQFHVTLVARDPLHNYYAELVSVGGLAAERRGSYRIREADGGAGTRECQAVAPEVARGSEYQGLAGRPCSGKYPAVWRARFSSAAQQAGPVVLAQTSS